MNGLDRIVRIRGGLKALKSTKILRLIIFWFVLVTDLSRLLR
jgi:hypothetical protein